MPIPLFDLLKLNDPLLNPNQTKIHLACSNGKEHPLDEYVAGKFEDWQSWQSQRNFERPTVLSLIQYRSVNKWLFAGVFDSQGCTPQGNLYRYNLSVRSTSQALRGRVIVDFDRTGRNVYRLGEPCANSLLVHQILPEPYTIQDFPGYRLVDISKGTLDLIVRLVPDSWRTALSSVAGVYLISDTKEGQLYVGSATGEGGIWQRWVNYSQTGHAGNQRLRQLLNSQGQSRAADFRFSVLEIADIHDTEANLLKREAHWKRILLTRDHGLNAN